MKILVVMGSPRKGNTYRAAEKIREILQSRCPVEFEYLMLGEMNLTPCRGCFTCLAKGEQFCPIKDQIPEIEEKIHNADGVIFASPVYGMNVSGQMKVFIDRLSYIFHRPRFFTKKALLLSTTGALGTKEVLDYLNLVAQVWGFEVAGRAGLITPPGKIPEYRKKKNDVALEMAADAFYQSLTAQRRRSPGLKDVVIFHGQRGSFRALRENAPADYQYWIGKGWFDPNIRYYTDIPVNPVYHAIGWIVERIAERQVKKDTV